jgi:hypothetical protein
MHVPRIQSSLVKNLWGGHHARPPVVRIDVLLLPCYSPVWRKRRWHQHLGPRVTRKH